MVIDDIKKAVSSAMMSRDEAGLIAPADVQEVVSIYDDEYGLAPDVPGGQR